MTLSQEEFTEWRDYIHLSSGIDIEESKSYLIEQRLSPLLESLNCPSYSELMTQLKSGDHTIRDAIIDAMTTNETYFFRDHHPFEIFNEVMFPWLMDKITERKNRTYLRKGPKVRIWSAASSTGQESFSLAMSIHEQLSRKPDHDLSEFSILATDISRKVLSKAMQGTFTQLEVNRGLSEQQRSDYFVKEGEQYVLREEILDLVEFKHMNLNDNFDHLEGVDVVFCRNVLIYFDLETRAKIVSNIHKLLSPDGFLVLGSMESLGSQSDLFKRHQYKSGSYFQKI